MNRRKLLLGLALAAAARPVFAQQSAKIRKIGVLLYGSANSTLAPDFNDSLRELGWIEGRNFTFEHRNAGARVDQLPTLAAELVQLNVDVIVAAATQAPLAAMQATSTIPIVMIGAGDPVGSGLVASLARPGGNVTGTSLEISAELGGKRLQLLTEVRPGISRVIVLGQARVSKELEEEAQKLAIQLFPVETRGQADLKTQIEQVMELQPEALITGLNPFTFAIRTAIAQIAIKNRLPSVFTAREFVDAGGLMSYGPNLAEMRRRIAWYVNEILRGAKPADLPVQQPTKFELVINLKAANELGLTMPPLLLARADAVIE